MSENTMDLPDPANAGIQGNITINGTDYRWIETSFGKNRGLTFNPGRYVYQFRPNPHDDRYYNKNQVDWYKAMVKEVAAVVTANNGKWNDNIKGTVNGTEYTLSFR